MTLASRALYDLTGVLNLGTILAESVLKVVNSESIKFMKPVQYFDNFYI